MAHHLFAVVMALSVLNGLFSPYLFTVLSMAPLWLPNWLPGGGAIYYMAIMIVSTTTLLLSGVPAALIENAFPSLRDTPTPMWIWAGTALILTLPAIVLFVAASG